jgi:exopolysaccharide/PEP-CTERM locus tyrosine autokinase
MAEKDRSSLLEMAARRLREPASQGSGAGPDAIARTGGAEQAPSSHAAAPDRGPTPAEQRPDVTIDLPRLKAQGYLTPDAQRTRVAEEFRIIKRPLLDNAFGRNSELVPHGNMIMVTSAVPGEGKTFTALNLAMSIATEMDKTVLLIDADVGRARLHDLLGTPLGPGLIDLLVDGSLDVGDVMLSTNLPKLRLIPMGRFHSHANELLASDNMRALTRQLETRYNDRVVIFDSPPILATSDPVVLSGIMGQVVFVVAAGSTPQGVVRDALSLIDDSKPIGMVLNKVRKSGGSSYYGYGSYGAGYYHEATA